jgi:hypothetical protein
MTGAGGVISAAKWDRRLTGASVITKQMLIEQNKLMTFTRWAILGDMPWFIDVLEHRFLEGKKLGGNVVVLKDEPGTVGHPKGRKGSPQAAQDRCEGFEEPEAVEEAVEL